MADKDTSPLSVNINRGLTDKLVERRKAAALELERMIKDLVMMNDYSQIKQAISALEHDFTLSSNANGRKGGLVGLAATAIALGRGCIGMHLPELVQPVLTCFEDQDARVRYYACESLYNISKVGRGAVLVFFNNIFEGLCKLSCDSDSNVRYGAELLDRLMKDIVSENPHFDIDNFILLLRDRIYTQEGFAKQFLVSWISFLDSVPDIHMHEHVPEFIDGLFCILGDQRKEIRRMAEETLGELLKEIEQHTSTVRFDAMTNIIAVHSQSEDKVIQFMALTWMKVFLDLAQRSMMVFTSNILISILPSVAYESEKSHIRDIAIAVNDRLKKLILPEDDEDQSTDLLDQTRESSPQVGHRTPDGTPKLDNKGDISKSDSTTSAPTTNELSPQAGQPSLKPNGTIPSSSPDAATDTDTCTTVLQERPKLHLLALLGVLIPHMKYTLQETRMETLRWLMWLHQQLPKRVYNQAGKLFPALLEMLTDQSDKVVRTALQVIAILSTSKAGVDLTETTKPTTSALVRTGSTSKAPGSPGKPRGATPSSSTKASAKTSPPKPNSNTKATDVATAAPKPHLNKYFRLFLVELLRMFDSDKSLLEKKGSFIIRQLCVYVDAHCVYCTLAEILYLDESLGFASLMVQVLNIILFTATELYELRVLLKELETPESWTLFTTLYHSWCHNPVATVALCLLSQNYEHAASLVQKFSDIEITAGILKETDKLVQLVESPIFAFLRLQLLNPHEHSALVRTLYGLQMLLPQSQAFSSLKQRLSSVPIITVVQQEDKKSKRPSRLQRRVPPTLSFDELLDHFVSMQQKHSIARRKYTTHAQNFRTSVFAANR